MFPIIYPLSETALVIEFGDSIDDTVNQQVLDLDKQLQQKTFPGFIETVPAYTTLTIYYQPESSPFDFVKDHVAALLNKVLINATNDQNIISIPVCYDDAFGYDLEFIATTHKRSKEEVIHIHQQGNYKVYMMGFLPGFAYMGPVDDAIAMPRKSTPRGNIEEGSVGIAGKQTGIYPLASPGGWQIIGRTPLCLFDIQKQDPFLFKTGDHVRFYSISKEEFLSIKDKQQQICEVKQEESIPDAVVVKPGLYASIQDGGRYGYQSYGVPISGAINQTAFHTANALVGNQKNAACIECTMGGIFIQFKKNAVITVTGAGVAFINGQQIRSWQPLSVSKNDYLEIRYNNDGMRSYIAVRGGIDTGMLMNSRSIYPKAGMGTALKKEDGLQFGNMAATASKRITENLAIPVYTTVASIRIITGPENDWIQRQSIEQLYSGSFTLTNQCDRMGYHLKGDVLALNNKSELLSTAVTKGTIQLTPSGQLIVLMSDCQTTGGYPRVAQVAAVDLPVITQLKPGDTIRFINISFEEAEGLYLREQKKINAFFS